MKEGKNFVATVLIDTGILYVKEVFTFDDESERTKFLANLPDLCEEASYYETPVHDAESASEKLKQIISELGL